MSSWDHSERVADDSNDYEPLRDELARYSREYRHADDVGVDARGQALAGNRALLDRLDRPAD